MSVIVIAGHDLVIGNCRRGENDALQNDPNANIHGHKHRLKQARLRQTLRRFHREEGHGHSGATPEEIRGQAVQRQEGHERPRSALRLLCVANGVLVSSRAGRENLRGGDLVEVIGCTLSMSGCSEDGTVVILENF